MIQKLFNFLCYLLLTLSCCASIPTVSSLAPTIRDDNIIMKKETTEEKDATAEVYRIVGIPGSGIQYLPKSYVKTFPRWNVDPAEKKLIPVEEQTTEGSCDSHSQSDNISVQPTLNFLVKGGVPTYVLVGLSVGAPNDTSNNHNYLAQQWTTFATTAAPNFRVELFLGSGDGADNSVGVVDTPKIREYMEVFGQAFATAEHHDLQSGFHIVTITMKMDTSKMETKQGDASTLTCVGTSESDAKQMLALDDDQMETKATSKLSIEASKVLSTA